MSRQYNIPPIPADVPLCHKNYNVAQMLAVYAVSGEIHLPAYMSKKAGEILTKDFSKNMKKKPEANVWYSIEEYFESLRERSKKSEGNASSDNSNATIAIITSDLDLSGNEGDSMSAEEILNLMDEKLERAGGMPENVKKALENVKPQRLEANFNKIIKAVDASVSFVRSREVTTADDYRNFDSLPATVREIARSKGKYMVVIPELETLAYYRALNGELTTIKPVQYGDRYLFVMVDDSGSMDDKRKKAYLNVILRYIKTKASDIKVYVYRFESDLYDDEMRIEADGELPTFSFGGGGTNVQNALNSLFSKIKEKGVLTENASILVINDGQDSVRGLNPPVKISALMLMENNEELKSASLKSGGVGFEIK